MRIENGDLIPLLSSASLAASITSSPIKIEHCFGYSIFVKWSGTPTGTLKLQCSNDPVILYGDVVNWDDITGATQALSGAAGQKTFNYAQEMYRWVRVVYVFSSGTGTITNANYMLKGI